MISHEVLRLVFGQFAKIEARGECPVPLSGQDHCPDRAVGGNLVSQPVKTVQRLGANGVAPCRVIESDPQDVVVPIDPNEGNL